MPTTKLLEKLLEIERSLGHEDSLTIRAMLMDAQDELMRVEAAIIRVMEDMQQLRQQQERSAMPAVSSISARAERPARAVAGVTRLAQRTA
jgi:hypothetical protein